jgi:predicted metal-dependent peptidase
MRLPKGALLEAQYVGRSAEWIYSNLPKQPQGGGQGQQQGRQGDTPGAGCGEVRQAKAQENGPDTKEQEARWEVAVQNAAAMAAGQGKLPAGVGIIVEELRRPRVDWRAELRRFVQQYAADDYSWVMPNRRYIASGFYLPTLRSESMPPIAIFGDSSGSTRRMLPMFVSEMQSIINEVQPEKTYFGWCDARVYDPDVFERGEPIDTKPKGGGGTDFRPVFEWIEQQGITPACLIFFTDLEGPFPQTPPDYPVLWITPTRNIAPFGETVEVQL